MTERSIVGDLINFRGLVYAPLNEQGVVFLFGKVAHDLNMYVEEIKPGFPDCIGRRFVGKGWERVRIEFEFQSSSFKAHGHNADDCDMIICWEHDWDGCPIEVIELSSEIRGMDNPPIERPGGLGPSVADANARLTAILKGLDAKPEVGEWYKGLFDHLRQAEPGVWAKVGDKYAGWYCPERAFVSLRPSKTSIQVECFSRGLPLEGAKVSNTRFAPRWARFTVKTGADVEKAGQILTESLQRIKEALAKGEPTGYFSGGQDASKTSRGSKDADAP
jgi:hypothetical protein